MAGGYTTKIMDPGKILATLRQYPVYCDDHGRDRLSVKTVLDSHRQQVQDLDAEQRAQDYLHLAADARISWFDMRPETQTNGKPWLKLHLEFQKTSAVHKSGKEFKTLRPIFYLPYKKNRMTRMKLAPPPTWQGGEVTFFATATINGCSVYVEGPGATPKVAHANAGDFSPPANSMNWADKTASIQRKGAFMDQRFQPLKSTAHARVISRPDYLASRATDAEDARRQYAARIGITPDRCALDSYNAIGAVVGIKHNGSWTFYLQRCASFSYRTKPGCGRGCECGCKSVEGYAVLSAEEIWPGGDGRFNQV